MVPIPLMENLPMMMNTTAKIKVMRRMMVVVTLGRLVMVMMLRLVMMVMLTM